MRIRFTFRRPSSRLPEANLQVTADATATTGDLANALASSEDLGTRLEGSAWTLRIIAGPAQGTVVHPSTSLLDSGIRSGAAVELAKADDANPHGQAVAAVLRVISGPDAGLEVPLARGTFDIGRATTSAITMRDPMVSKLHARLTIGDRVELVDVNSANGVLVGGVRVSKVQLGAGDVALLGSDEVSVTSVQGDSGPVSSTDIHFVRSPRVLQRPVARQVELPNAPSSADRNRFPWLAMVLPIAMGGVLYLATGSLKSIIFVGLAPLMMIGNYIDQRVQGKRRMRMSITNFEEDLAQVTEELEKAQVTERQQLERMFPAQDELLRSVQRADDLLWSRRPEHPEFLQLRLGLGTIRPVVVPARVRPNGMASYVRDAQEVATRFAVLPEAPVVADLRSVGGLGLCGQRSVLDGVARSVVGQVAVVHSPAEVVLACLTSPAGGARWSWLEWLPHTFSPQSPLGDLHLSADPANGKRLLDNLEELMMLRRGSGSGDRLRGPIEARESQPHPVVPSVVVVADEPTVDRARLSRLAELGPDVGIFVLWVADTKGGLPGACRTYVDVGQGGPVTVGMVRAGELATDVVCDQLPVDTATTLARTLAPMVDAGAPTEDDSDLPRTVPVVSLIGVEESDDPDVVLGRWRENGSYVVRDGSPPRPLERPSSLRAVVGHAGTEPFHLDLRTQGPHALVGGTTGAGKSEFLQAWVLGMAHALSPDRVTFLFVDYKGGAAFAKCVELPHNVGLVTDLSPYLVRRALRSLRAELVHREHLLNKRGAKDLLELEMTGDPECPPSLVIVVDEFAALVGEVPEFVDGVVDVAQRGRSLGLHLVLATQRPAGVIKENLRANTNLRVALRVADEHDSNDVLGSPMAAHFDPGVPGRGAAKTGPGRITPFQSAFPGSRTPATPLAPPIDVLEFDFGQLRAWRLPERTAPVGNLPKDIDRVVDTIAAAARRGNITAPRKPWLDSLAEVYNLERLRQREDSELVLGVLDDPDSQSQRPEYFRPDDEGNILYIGAGGSGKSTALRSLALAASITPKSGLVHVYGLDFAGGALTALQEMPNVGAIVPGDDEERVARLLRMLSEMCEERLAEFSAARAGTILDYRALPGKPMVPRILLLLDGFPTFRSEYESTLARMPIYTLFQRLLVDGRAAGIHVAMSADRPSAVPTSVSSAFQRKVVLRQSQEDAYLALNVPKDVLSPSSPPGRAMQVDAPQELQLAIFGDDVNVAAQARLIEELAAELSEMLVNRNLPRPEPVRSLPASVPAAEMPAEIGGFPVLGVEDVSLEPISFRPSGAICVAGPAQSGRTSAVRWFAESIHRRWPETLLVHISARRSPLSGLDIWRSRAGDVTQAEPLLARLKELLDEPPPERHPLMAVFVENYTDFLGTPVDQAMIDVVKLCRRHGHILVAESETSGWSAPWPLMTEVRNARTGLLLQPDASDGDTMLKTSLPRGRRTDFPPGRGYWVQGGRAVKVQLPLVE